MIRHPTRTLDVPHAAPACVSAGCCPNRSGSRRVHSLSSAQRPRVREAIRFGGSVVAGRSYKASCQARQYVTELRQSSASSLRRHAQTMARETGRWLYTRRGNR